MSLAERLIPSNTATAALRRIAIHLVDETDKETPEDITVTGVKVSLSIDGGTLADSTNDIVKVSGTVGLYYLELTQAEVNQAAGTEIWGTLQPAGCAREYLKVDIGQADVYASTVNANVTSVEPNAITAGAIEDGAFTAAKFASGAFDAVWTVATRGLTTFGSLASDVATAVWGAGTRSLTTFGTLVSDTASAAATAVWAAGARTLTGFGTLVADVWSHGSRVLTGGDNIVLAKGTGLTGLNDLSAAQVNAEADQALADAGVTPTVMGRLDEAISTRATPADVASAVSGLAEEATLEALGTIAAAIQQKTDALPAQPAAAGDIPSATDNADALLGRSIAGGADGGRTVTSALRRMRNRLAIASGVLSVYAEDDTTVDHTAAVTTTAGDPVSEIDPT